MKKKLIALILTGTLAAGSLFSAHADEISDMEAEAAYTQSLIEDINASIDDLENQKTELLGQIDATDQELVLTLAAISTLNTQIELKTQQLSETTRDLRIAEEEEATEYAAMKRRIQYLYETGGEAGWATILLNDLDISDMLNRAEYTEKIYAYDRECLEHYASVVELVSSLKSSYEKEKTDLENMLANQQEQQAHLEEQLAYLQATSDDYDAQIAGASEAAAAYVELLNEQNYMIQELLAEQERQRIAAEEAAAAAAAAAAEAAAAEAAAAEAAAAEAAAAEAAAEAARQAAEEAQRAAAEAESEAAIQAAEEAQRAAEEAQRAAEEAAQRAAEEEAQRAAEEAQRAAEEEQGGGEEGYYEEGGGEEEVPYYSETGNAVVDRAYAWVGRAEYVWGACSPGAFDCSGFVSYCITGAYARLGTTYTFMGYPQVSDPQPGDICTSATHCGIYVGNGLMVHASDYGVGVIESEVRPDMIFVRA